MRRALSPLAPGTFLVRNVRQTVPLVGVIMLAVLLVFGIISMINSIPLSIRTIYGYSKYMLGVSPRGDPALTMAILGEIESEAPVPVERVMICRASSSVVKSIVGEWQFGMLAFNRPDMEYFLQRMGTRRLEGRLPNKGAAEAVISEPVSRNLKLKIGDAVLKPEDSSNYSPKPVIVVGIAHTDNWLMFSDLDYYRANHFPPVDLGIVFAKNIEDQPKLDNWAYERFKGQRAAILVYQEVEKTTNEMFVTLYRILDVVIGTLVLVITFMMGMLINIYQSQRLVEFGLLQALGYTRKALVRRVLVETLIVVLLGWALGLALSQGLLWVVKQVLMYPNAYALALWDWAAFRYTIPVPIAIFIVALATVFIRFRRYDPVGVVERRLI